MKENRLKGKDFITIAIFTVLLIIVDTVISMVSLMIFGMKFAMTFGVGIAQLISMSIFLLMAAKVKKPGVIFLSALLKGIIYTIMSTPIMLIITVVAGIIGELIVSIPKKNDSMKINAVGYSVFTMIYSLHGIIIFKFLSEERLAKIKATMFTPEQVSVVEEISNSVGPILLSLLVIAVLSLVGYFIAKGILKKNFEKAGVI